MNGNLYLDTMTTADFESFVLRPREHSNAKLLYFAVTTTVDRLPIIPCQFIQKKLKMTPYLFNSF